MGECEQKKGKYICISVVIRYSDTRDITIERVVNWIFIYTFGVGFVLLYYP